MTRYPLVRATYSHLVISLAPDFDRFFNILFYLFFIYLFLFVRWR